VEELELIVIPVVVEEAMVSRRFILLFPDLECLLWQSANTLVAKTQSGGAGGRGGGLFWGDDKPYCDDNAHSGRHDGQYCSLASWSGCCNTGGSPGDAYDNDNDVSLLMYLPGSGGGAGAGTPGRAGGNGGASIVLYSNEMTLNGVIKANGGNGGNGQNPGSGGGGGGSGGTVRIAACTVTTGSNGLSAIIQAKGGNGGSSPSYGKMIFPIHLFTFSSSFSLSLFR
jgi:hypothetical protein